MKRLLFLLGVTTTLVGCSNTYIKSTVDGTIVEAKQYSNTIMIPVSTGKTTTYIPNTNYSCTYKIEIDGTVVTIKTGHLCRYKDGEVVRVQSAHDKDTDEFVKYQILE